MKFLVTTNQSYIPSDNYTQIVMIDGTVPGWQAKPIDLHFDHHCPGGAAVQIDEIPDKAIVNLDAAFVTTQVDADACAAAAWLIVKNHLDECQSYDARLALWCIAHDCDHLGLPLDAKFDPYREFAAKAVAALKQSGFALASKLGLPSDRKTWSEDQQVQYASAAFESGTMALVEAAENGGAYPGELGEADEYFENMARQRPMVFENCQVIDGVAVFDQRSFDGYVDPRLPLEWARQQPQFNGITLTVRDGRAKPNAASIPDGIEVFAYTLGSDSLRSPQNFSDRGIWDTLTKAENAKRRSMGLPELDPGNGWGGRNAVGGSSWRNPVFMRTHEIVNFISN